MIRQLAKQLRCRTHLLLLQFGSGSCAAASTAAHMGTFAKEGVCKAGRRGVQGLNSCSRVASTAAGHPLHHTVSLKGCVSQRAVCKLHELEPAAGGSPAPGAVPYHACAIGCLAGCCMLCLFMQPQCLHWYAGMSCTGSPACRHAAQHVL